MKINSAAGEFEFEITAMELETRDVVLVGTMGVWEARTVIDHDEMTRLLALSLRSSAFWKLVPRLPAMLVRAMFNRANHKSAEPPNV